MNIFKNKNILITGVSGFVGNAIINYFIQNKIDFNSIIGIDNNENSLFELNKRVSHKKINFYLCDLRNSYDSKKYFININFVIHLASYKHVELNEKAPFNIINNNIFSLQTVIDESIKNKVTKVIYASSDKAVNPTNVMGTSKLLCEKILSSSNSRNHKTIFSSVRFGNIINSSGSVIPIFLDQIKNNSKLTITDKRMTRFILTSEDAINLLFFACNKAKGGEIFVKKMKSLRILDLAKVILNLKNNIEIKNTFEENIIITGIKFGEKLYEEILTDEEYSRTVEMKDYFQIIPSKIYFYNGRIKIKKSNNIDKIKPQINSNFSEQMGINKIKKFLKKNLKNYL